MAEPANQNILDVEISEEPSNTDRAQDIADAWAKFNLLTLGTSQLDHLVILV